MRTFIVLLCLVIGSCVAESHKSRTLKQSDEESFTSPKLGPEAFFDQDFYLTVKGGIVVHVYGGEKVTNIVLDQKSKSVQGSFINKTDFSVTIDWKTAKFQATSGDTSLSLEGIILKMNFKKKGKEFVLTKIDADQMVIGGTNRRNLEIKVKSKFGYVVSAPIGSCFDCTDTGVFPPAQSQSSEYRVGLSFPKMKLQVFELKTPRFGPSWTCDSVFSIGVWVGLLTTIFFALICFWGFGMLANIQTMDRFDDPKGKPIHVPQTE